MAPKTYGDLIREYRARAGWTQAQLAEYADYGGHSGHSTISKIEKGRLIPPREGAQKLILALREKARLRRRDYRELAAAYLLTDQQRSVREERPIIGLLVPSFGGSMFWGPIVAAIEEEARDHHWVAVTYQHHNDVSRQLAGFGFFEDFDALYGIIAVPAFGRATYDIHELEALDAAILRLVERDVPTVFLDRRIALDTVVPYVGVKHDRAAYDAVIALWAQGHRRIGALFDLQHTYPQQERLRGFQQALADKKLTYNPAWIKFGREVRDERRDFEREQGYRGGKASARELLRLPPDERPTAIFCASGHLALSVRDAVMEMAREGSDIAIPDSLSVIGFDDLREFDRPSPTISRVCYETSELGRVAFDKIKRLRENMTAADAREPTELDHIETILAESIGPPPSR